MTLAAQIALVATSLFWLFVFNSSSKDALDFHDQPHKVRIGAAIYSFMQVVAVAIPLVTAANIWYESSWYVAMALGICATPVLLVLQSDYVFRTPFIRPYLFAYSLASSRAGAKREAERIEKLASVGRELGL